MNDDGALEDLVASFLDLRDGPEPGLEPEAFAARQRPELREALLAAIRGALEASRLLPDGGGPELLPLSRARVGAYRVVREIGRGGMGIVFEAERDGRRFALKWLPNAPLLGARAIERVKREAAALARLDHPNVVAIRDSGSEDGVPFLVMDLVEGEPLSSIVGKPAPREAAALVRRLALAVQAVHDRGVLHRDLKPQNVVVRPDGEPVLVDFGLVAADDLASITSTGDFVGTPRYMAPEQARGLETDARTDVHALGLVLYELATGRAARESGSRDSVALAIAAGAFPAPRVVRPDVPADLEKIVLVALAVDPRRRYPSAAAMADDLARFLDGEPVTARPPGPLLRAAAAARRRPARTALVAAVALLALALGALLLRPRSLSPEDARRAHDAAAEAAAAFLDGRGADAVLAAADRALAIDPGQPLAAALRAAASGGEAPAGARPAAAIALDGLRLLAAGDHAAASARLREAAALDPAVVVAPAAAGFAAARARDFDGAVRELVVAGRVLPSSRRVAEELAAAYRKTQQFAAAEAELVRAIALEPERAALWVELAQVRLQRESLDDGLVAAREAVRLAGADDAEAGTVLAGLLDARGEREAAREILRGVIAKNPRYLTARTRLALSLDSDHAAEEAAAAYRDVIELDAVNAFALTYLANLHAGADRGRCRGCDAAYARWPDLLDGALAEGYLVRAIASDAGRSPSLSNTILGVAQKLESRDAVKRELEALTEGKEKTPEVLRLEWLLRRLRLAETEPK